MKKPATKTKGSDKDPLSVKDLPAKERTASKIKGGLTLPGVGATSGGCTGGTTLNLRGSLALSAGCTGGVLRPS